MRRVAWVGLLAVLGVGVWLFLREAGPGPSDENGQPSSTVPAEDRPQLVGSPVAPSFAPPGFAPAPPGPSASIGPADETPVGRGRVAGRVVDVATGRGAEGAWIHAAPPHAAPPFPRAVADAEGRFEIEDVPAGQVLVVVLGGGWHGVDVGDLRYDMLVPSLSRALRLEADETGTVELEAARAAIVEGRVIDAEGRTVAGARVRPVATPRHHDSWRIPAAPLEVESTVDGTFHLDTLVAGLEYRVQAFNPDVAPGLSEPFRADPAAPTYVDVRLPPSRHLLVQVRRAAEDTPVIDAVASWTEADPAVQNTLHGGSAEGDREGRIRVGPLAPGALAVRIAAEGYVRQTVQLSAEDEGEIRRRVFLEPGLSLAGRVLDRDGMAVPGAWLTCGRGEEGQNQTAFSDDEGTFCFDGLAPGPWTLAVWVGDGMADLTTQAEAGREDVVLRVEATLASALVLHVLGPDGKPIPRFEVATATAFGMGGGDWGDGRYEIEAGQDVDWVEIRRARDAQGAPLGYAPALLDVRHRSQGERTVRLEPGAALDGVVLDPDGRGVPGLPVSAERERSRGLSLLAGPEAETQTDADGRFQLVGLAQGSHRLFVSVPSRYAPVPRRTVVAGATDVTIRLRDGATFRPRIVGPEGGPVTDARVQVTRLNGGGLCWEKCGLDGVVLLAGLLADGRYGLEVRPPDDRIDLRTLEVEAWRPSNEPIVLDRAQVVEGRVVDGSGKPVEGAAVTSRASGGTWAGSARTDGEGHFVLGGLATGPVELRAYRYGEPALGSACVPIAPAASADVDGTGPVLVVEPLVELVVRIEGAPHPPGRGDFRFRLRSASGDARPQDVEAGVGRFFVRPDARYDLHVVFAEDGLVAWREGIRGDAGAVSVGCVPSREIRGRVLVPSDTLSVRVGVEERGVRSRCTPEADGTFRLQGLPAGTWRVEARVLRPDGAVERTAATEADAEVTIDLR